MAAEISNAPNERSNPLFKNIPKVDKVMEWPEVRNILAAHPRQVVVDAIRGALDSLRAATARGETTPESYETTAVLAAIVEELEKGRGAALRRVINGTGVIIHTNLGRAPLPEAVLEAVRNTSAGYCDLEFDLEKGVRGSRTGRVEELLRRIIGAEAAIVVNNNAAAVLLALSALARGREVVVSRGELVEIGGSFRIPDVMTQSGAALREVGTTNRTHPRDYRSAVTTETALLLKVHTSNFRVMGFTAEVSVSELAGIGRESGIPVMVDAGSGNLVDLSFLGVHGEPTIGEYLASGADVVTFSGDKLLGGPQAGIIVGKKAYLDAMKTHPLYRALRVDKMTLAVLDGILRLYADERQAMQTIPVLQMMNMDANELASRARRLVGRLRRNLPSSVTLKTKAGLSQVGGGSLPEVGIPTTLVSVSFQGITPDQLDQRLRTGPQPIVGRINQGEFLLDVRTIRDDEQPIVVSALKTIAESA